MKVLNLSEEKGNQSKVETNLNSSKDGGTRSILRLQKFCCIVQWILLITGLVISVPALCLSISNTLSRQPNQVIQEVSTSRLEYLTNQLNNNTLRLQDVIKLSSELEQLNQAIQGLNASLEQLINNSSLNCVLEKQLVSFQLEVDTTLESLMSNISELNSSLYSRIMEIDSQFEMFSNTVQGLLNKTTNQTLELQLDLYSGCKQHSTECVIDHTAVGIPPSSRACETATLDLEEVGYKNINIYCSIDNSGEETNPIVATLNIFGGEASCLCSIIAPSTAPTFSPPCTLVIQRCPNTLHHNP